MKDKCNVTGTLMSLYQESRGTQRQFSGKYLYPRWVSLREVKIEGRSNFNFQGTKTLYQNNFNHIAPSFLHFSRAISVISFTK